MSGTVYIDHSYSFDGTGRTTRTNRADHIRDLIEQLLFTAPGERVNRPEFGSGLMQLVFAPNSAELAAAVQFTTQSAIQQWLGDLIDVERLSVEADEAVLRVSLTYSITATGEVVTAELSGGVP